MAQNEKFHRLITIRNQYIKKKNDAKKEMKTGNLQGYFEKLNAANELRNEFSQLLSQQAPLEVEK